jgi:gliding motility-associated-like protein
MNTTTQTKTTGNNSMNRFMKSIALVLFGMLLFTNVAKSQVSVFTTTLTWTTGWCNICGPQTGNYACNPPWSGSGTWNNGIRTFVTAIPPGQVVTAVCVTINKVNCGYTNLCVSINGVTIGCQPPTPPGNCSCGACFPETFCANYPCPTGLAGFVNNGTNTLQLGLPGNQGPICVNNAIVTLSYQACCPSPTLAVTGNTAICSGQTTTLTASPTGSVPVNTYTWVGPGATTLATTNQVIVTPGSTTTYTVYGTSPFPCTGSQTVQVQVNPSPTVTPGNSSPVCQNGTLALTASVVAGGTLTTYMWNGPQSYTSAFQNPQIPNIQVNQGGLYTVTATMSFTNGGACSTSTTTSVNVIPVNQVSVTPQYTLCQNSNLNLQAINGVPPTNYGWTGPNAWTSTLSAPTINNVNPTHNGNYCVTATFAVQGLTFVCTSTACSNVSVVATSPVTLALPQNLCEGATAFMSATANPMPLTFNWTGPNNFSANGTSTSIVNVDPLNSGLYNVTGTWAIGTKSCYITNFGQLNVVDVNPVVINPPVSVCYPANVQLTSNSSGAIGYTWTSTTGYTSNLPNPLLGAPGTTATGIYTVTTAYSNGALICYNNNTTQVTVNPIIPFTLDPYKQLCFGATYTISGPPGATAYLWSGPNSYTNSNQVMMIPSMQPVLAGTYSLEVTLGPCKTFGATKIEVLTPISWTSTPGSAVICQGDSVALYLGASGGSHNYAYTWNPQQWLGSPTGSVQYGHPNGTTIYNVTAYDIACPFYTIANSFTVLVNKAPEPNLDLQVSEGCQPLCLHWNSRTQENATDVIYDFGSGNLMQADDFDYCLQDAGTYNIKIRTTGKNGCSYTYDYKNPINVWPLPGSDFSTNPDRITTTNNNATFLPSNRGNVISYQWTFSGIKGMGAGYDTSSMVNPVRIYDNTGDFPVLLVSTTDKGCKDTIFKVIEVRDEFSIFIPNSFTPNGDNLNDVFNIKGVGIKTEGYSMEIYNRWGTLVYSTKDLNKGWDGTVSGLNGENGVYVYKVKALGSNGEGKKEYTGHVSLLK